MKDVLYIPGLKKNILSVSTLDAKGLRVSFVDGQFLMWPKGKTIYDATVILKQDRGLYKLKGHPEKALVHESIEPSEILNQRITHVHYKSLTVARKEVSGLP